jgi:hypothetical protein
MACGSSDGEIDWFNELTLHAPYRTFAGDNRGIMSAFSAVAARLPDPGVG